MIQVLLLTQKIIIIIYYDREIELKGPMGPGGYGPESEERFVVT